MSKFLMYLQRSTSKAFGYGIVSRKTENRFSTDFCEAAILRNREDWGGDWTGQPRSSQPEEEFRDLGDSGEPGAGPEEDFKGFWKDFERIRASRESKTLIFIEFY